MESKIRAKKKITNENYQMDSILPFRIYKPLNELKYVYESKSRPSTMDAMVSTVLPLIKPKSIRQFDFYLTNNYRYLTTIHHIFEMKSECGHIYDQISLIDFHMKEDEEKYKTNLLKYDKFVRSFESFLSCQYERVSTSQMVLKNYERESEHLNSILNELERTITEKSLRVYDIERLWRKFKVSQKFLTYIAELISSTTATSYNTQIFNVNPKCKTPSLDEIIKNFEQHDDQRLFSKKYYEHVTTETVGEFLCELRNHNHRLLNLKSQRKNLKDEIMKTKMNSQNMMEKEKQSVLMINGRLRHDVKELTCQSNDRMTKESEETNFLVKLKASIEIIYKECFETDPIRNLHLQMIQDIEEHSFILLNELNSCSYEVLMKYCRQNKQRLSH